MSSACPSSFLLAASRHVWKWRSLGSRWLANSTGHVSCRGNGWGDCTHSIGPLDGVCYWPLQGLLSSWAAGTILMSGGPRRFVVWLYGSAIHWRTVSPGSWVTGSQKTSCLLLRFPLVPSAPPAALFCTWENTEMIFSLLSFRYTTLLTMCVDLLNHWVSPLSWSVHNSKQLVTIAVHDLQVHNCNSLMWSSLVKL